VPAKMERSGDRHRVSRPPRAWGWDGTGSRSPRGAGGTPCLRRQVRSRQVGRCPPTPGRDRASREEGGMHPGSGRAVFAGSRLSIARSTPPSTHPPALGPVGAGGLSRDRANDLAWRFPDRSGLGARCRCAGGGARNLCCRPSAPPPNGGEWRACHGSAQQRRWSQGAVLKSALTARSTLQGSTAASHRPTAAGKNFHPPTQAACFLPLLQLCSSAAVHWKLCSSAALQNDHSGIPLAPARCHPIHLRRQHRLCCQGPSRPGSHTPRAFRPLPKTCRQNLNFSLHSALD
jgi:hypothetical protein